MDLSPDLRRALLDAAAAAAARAYAPYSRFRVGAAVLADGMIHAGCNVENASYGLSFCAERAAIVGAVAAGRTRLQAIAVAFPDLSEDADPTQRVPCGACRQVMAEFADGALPVITAGAPDRKLADLLPHAFRLRA